MKFLRKIQKIDSNHSKNQGFQKKKIDSKKKSSHTTPTAKILQELSSLVSYPATQYCSPYQLHLGRMRLSNLPPRNRRKGSRCGWGFVVRVCTPVFTMLLSKEVVFLLATCLFHSSLTTKKRRFMYVACLTILNCT